VRWCVVGVRIEIRDVAIVRVFYYSDVKVEIKVEDRGDVVWIQGSEGS
jgi:hypothetical protein